MSSFLGERCLDFVLLSERSVVVSGVTLVATYLFYWLSGKFLRQRYTMFQPGTFIESIEGQFSMKDIPSVTLRSELNTLGFADSAEAVPS